MQHRKALAFVFMLVFMLVGLTLTNNRDFVLNLAVALPTALFAVFFVWLVDRRRARAPTP